MLERNRSLGIIYYVCAKIHTRQLLRDQCKTPVCTRRKYVYIRECTPYPSLAMAERSKHDIPPADCFIAFDIRFDISNATVEQSPSNHRARSSLPILCQCLLAEEKKEGESERKNWFASLTLNETSRSIILNEENCGRKRKKDEMREGDRGREFHFSTFLILTRLQRSKVSTFFSSSVFSSFLSSFFPHFYSGVSFVCLVDESDRKERTTSRCKRTARDPYLQKGSLFLDIHFAERYLLFLVRT